MPSVSAIAGDTALPGDTAMVRDTATPLDTGRGTEPPARRALTEGRALSSPPAACCDGS